MDDEFRESQGDGWHSLFYAHDDFLLGIKNQSGSKEKA